MSKSFLIDSNIIIYSIDDTSTWYYPANLIIEKSKINLYISIQNIAETYRVITDSKRVTNPYQPVDAQKIVFKKVGHLRLIYPSDKTIKEALNLAITKATVGVDIYDCLLAQVVIENKIDGVITHDNDFEKKYKNIFSVIDLQKALIYL